MYLRGAVVSIATRGEKSGVSREQSINGEFVTKASDPDGIVEVVTGGFDSDGRTDIVLVKAGGQLGQGLFQILIVYDDDNGKWKVTYPNVGEFGKI